MKNRISVAVVGCGIGRAHAAAYKELADQFDLQVICDLDEGKAAEVAAASGAAEAMGDFGKLVARHDVDLIDLCTPPHLHFPQIQQALRAGKHVVCEKPLVGSLAEADALAELEREAGRKIIPVFQYRFGQGLQKLRHLVRRGIAGKAYLATVETAWRRRASYYDLPWRGRWQTELGGAVLGHAIHAHDMLYYILGPAKRVFARTSTRVNAIEVEDCAAISLEMHDGSLATLAVTLGSACEITRHRFCFESLTAESNTAPYHNSKDPWTFSADGAEQEARIHEALEGFSAQGEYYVGQFERIHHALCAGGELPVKLVDARNALELITAIYYSAETGRDVSLPIGPDHPYYGSWIPEHFREEAVRD